MIFLNNDKLNEYICVLNSIVEMYVPFSWKYKYPDQNKFLTGFPTKYGIVTFEYTMDNWDKFKVPVIPGIPKSVKLDSLEILNILTNTIKESGSSYMNNEDYSMVLSIVRRDILPLFDGDKLKEATFISFFNK